MLKKLYYVYDHSCLCWCCNFSALLIWMVVVVFISAPAIKSSGECGVLYRAEPLDACSPLTNKVQSYMNASNTFVLIIRGGCSFEDKVRRAQKAGYKAAIIYDNEEGGVLVASNDCSLST